MSHTDLSLDRNKIDSTINSLTYIHVDGPHNLGGSQEGVFYNIQSKKDAKSTAIINIYSKGIKTSLLVQGKDIELGQRVVDFVIENSIEGIALPF